jgi:hypothetical protein
MRRLQEELNYFCQCGHPKRLHEGEHYEDYCIGRTFTFPRSADVFCTCREYRLDNLRYLEAEITRREQKQNDDSN